jgi:hypothetical protein
MRHEFPQPDRGIRQVVVQVYELAGVGEAFCFSSSRATLNRARKFRRLWGEWHVERSDAR